jgi:hypothetical protein
MKKLLFFVALLPLFFISCEKSGEAGNPLDYFSVDLQSSFDHDSIIVALDNKIIYNKTATTLDVLSLADKVEASLKTGKHYVKVTLVQENVSNDFTFDACSKEVTIAVQYDRINKIITFKKYDFILFYD